VHRALAELGETKRVVYDPGTLRCRRSWRSRCARAAARRTPLANRAGVGPPPAVEPILGDCGLRGHEDSRAPTKQSLEARFAFRIYEGDGAPPRIDHIIYVRR
jgi:hypothetical protein